MELNNPVKLLGKLQGLPIIIYKSVSSRKVKLFLLAQLHISSFLPFSSVTHLYTVKHEDIDYEKMISKK
jgi:hypothetical protein